MTGTVTRRGLPFTTFGATPFEREIGRPAERYRGETVVEAGILMRDGVVLAADVYLPPEETLPVPAIVTITPYGKSSPGRLDADALSLRAAGYAVVVVDCRGRGKSEGTWIPARHDARDGHDVVEWAADAAWSTGAVGMTGHSYSAWVAWAAASENPRGLSCIVSSSAIGAWQEEIPFHRGVLQLNCAWWLYGVRRRIQERPPGDASVDWDRVLRLLPVDRIRDELDIPRELWDSVMIDDTLAGWDDVRFPQEVYDAIDVPALHVTGWFDLEDMPGAFRHYERMTARGDRSTPQHLIVGPWNHPMVRWPHSDHGGIEYGPEAAVDMSAVHRQWFDRWLKPGADTGTEDVPVWVWETGTERWRAERSWPRANDATVLYLAADRAAGGLVGTLAPAFTERTPEMTYSYDPLDPVMTGTRVHEYGQEDIPVDQTETEEREDVLIYTSTRLTSAITLSGRAQVYLEAATDGDDTDWHVKLTDVDRHGRSTKVAQACMRASHREGSDSPAPVPPGRFMTYALDLWPAQHVFLPGHRIRVSVTSSDFPWSARNLNRFGPLHSQSDPRTAVNTVRHAGVSRIVLPIEVCGRALDSEGPNGEGPETDGQCQ
ncbi:CocE/NonD family hydrolase [Microbacterium trichothecenolyticum]|uniref:CocE/NonD family hydrolase n=1 Tax=Microbacterium trichothecenolyticum TaxID=69370 RepID=A0ABU0TRE1_MICTR|nr:CocE/NonD family hydrolase [Microbacterium trichothecenolyticum]MDQ1121519.1 putative CocE/NonD family hydrolase [Microbacterium trichothecenolyticum]